jgi:hypothetical protein
LINSSVRATSAINPLHWLAIYSVGLERAGGQPCRHPPVGALNQFLDESGYCITSVACKSTHFRPGGGVEIEPDAHLLAIGTKVAFTIASLLLGIGQRHGHGSGGADMIIP